MELDLFSQPAARIPLIQSAPRAQILEEKGSWLSALTGRAPLFWKCGDLISYPPTHSFD
jgi:hypothetical protein